MLLCPLLVFLVGFSCWFLLLVFLVGFSCWFLLAVGHACVPLCSLVVVLVGLVVSMEQQGLAQPDPSRLGKVKKSMARIKVVLGERGRAGEMVAPEVEEELADTVSR